MPGNDFCPGVIFAQVHFAHPGKMYPEFNGPLSGGTSLKNNFFRGARGWVLALWAKTQPGDARKKILAPHCYQGYWQGKHPHMCGYTSNRVRLHAVS